MENILVTKNDIIGTYKSMKYAEESLSKYGHLLPITSSVKLAEVAAILLTDGSVHIKPRFKSYQYSWVAYYSKEGEELIQFEKLILNLFNIKGAIKDLGIRKFGIRYAYFIINSFLVRTLSLCGIPGGDKVKNEYGVPYWIINGTKEIRATFLRKSFDCEGSIGFSRNRKRWEIRYSMYKLDDLKENCKGYLNQLGELLKNFGIYSIIIKKEQYFRKIDGRLVQGYNLRIDKNESVLNYAKYIGFGNINKKTKLAEAVTSILKK
ncbi:hypothetical protein HYX09_03865 [Candidatus Woesearchaeota archaeon]|nr:hypothetical protein [Candidatus Woesearchaeota archaeon]MBI2661375.1 hypothetical protein [Candidatus Woesearchaeota archaeon]